MQAVAGKVPSTKFIKSNKKDESSAEDSDDDDRVIPSPENLKDFAVCSMLHAALRWFSTITMVICYILQNPHVVSNGGALQETISA